jgi:hypothetical protein
MYAVKPETTKHSVLRSHTFFLNLSCIQLVTLIRENKHIREKIPKVERKVKKQTDKKTNGEKMKKHTQKCDNHAEIYAVLTSFRFLLSLAKPMKLATNVIV